MAGIGVIRQDRKNEDPLISGLLKVGTGSAKALAGGAVNLVKSVPGGVGKLIGAKEKTPPQYIPSPGMEDISAGVSNLKRAGEVITSIPGRTRRGVMSALDLEDLPITTPNPETSLQEASTSPVQQRQIPPIVGTEQKQTSPRVGTGQKLPVDDTVQTAKNRRASSGVGKPLSAPAPVEEDLNTKIETLVDKLYTDPRNRVPSNQRLRTGVLGAITNLRATQAGLVGTKADAVAKAEYHKILRDQLSAKGLSPDDISKIADRFTPKEQKVMEIDASGIPKEVVKPPDYKEGLRQTQGFLRNLGYDIDFGIRDGGIDLADFESSYTSSLKASGKKDTPKARASAMKRYRELMGIKE